MRARVRNVLRVVVGEVDTVVVVAAVAMAVAAVGVVTAEEIAGANVAVSEAGVVVAAVAVTGAERSASNSVFNREDLRGFPGFF